MDAFAIISFFIAFLIGITIHESAHAWTGHRLGDSTAKDLGRISLNPLRHIDPVGTLLLPLIGLLSPSHSFFGWAKPTPYNPANLKDGHKDEVLIALAGPISNLLLATAVFILLKIIIFIKFTIGISPALLPAVQNTFEFLYFVAIENLLLAFFNLLPLPPLDGASLLKILLPKKFHFHLAFFNQYGFMILMFSSMTPLGNVLGAYLDTCINFCLKIVGFS